MGQVQASDADGDTLTFSLTDDAGGLFAIDGATGVITVAGVLDYETASSHQLTVRVADPAGAFSEQQYSVSVVDQNEAPDPVVAEETVLSVLDFEGGVLAEGWSDANGSEIVTLGGPYGVSPYEGEYGLELDNGAGGTPDALYYTVATGQGLSHKVSLRVHERPGGDGSDHVEVVWNGEVLETINPTDAWGEYVVTLPDTGLASTQLAIREVAGQDDGSGPLLDLITLSRMGDVNTPAEIGGVDTGAMTEDSDATLTASGTLTISHPTVARRSLPPAATAACTVPWALDAAGNWTYSADNSQSAIQSLGDGVTLSDTVIIQSEGGTDHTLTLTVTGSNDGAVISGTDSGSVSEDSDSMLTVSGALSISDVDAGEAQFTAGTINGSYGDLTLDASGNWSYSADNSQPAIQSLNDGETLSDTLTVYSLDGTAHTVTITVNGRDDAPDPVVTEETVLSVLDFEGGVLAEGWSDANGSEIVTLGGPYGVSPYEGEYGLELDNGAGGTPDALYYTVATGQGLSHKVSLRVHERPGGDGSDHVEVVWNGEVLETINPTDAWGEYVVTLPDTGLASTQLAIREVAGQDDGSGPLLDLITLSRVDVVENAPPEFILNGETYAGLVLDTELVSNGDFATGDDWTLSGTIDVSDALQFGGGGDFSDGVAEHVMPGYPDVNYALSLGYRLGGNPTATGQVEVIDQATGDILATESFSTDSDSLQTLNLGFTARSAGNMVIRISDTTEHGAATDLWVDNVSVQAASADNPELATAIANGDIEAYLTQLAIAEDAQPGTEVGQVQASDADGDTLTFSLTDDAGGLFAIDGATGVITVAGVLDYETASSHQLTVRVADPAGAFSEQQYSVSVVDQHEAPDPVVAEETVLSVLDFEGGVLAEGWSDANGSEIVTLGGPYGVSPYEGEYGLELDNGAGGTPDALYYTVATGQGLSHKVSLRVHERPDYDGTDHVEVVWNGEVLETINPTDAWGEYVVTLPDTGLASTQLAIREVAGQDDGGGPLLDLITLSRMGDVNTPAEIGGVDTGAMTEDSDATLTASGTLTISHPDSGQAQFAAGSYSGLYGTVGLDAAGNWTYSADNSQPAIQSLGDGDTLSDTVTIQSEGGTDHTLTLTVTGSNDGAVISGTDSGSVAKTATAC
ncbi:VCBS domain-containing protein [Endozoicomonas sp. SCSIO W0465]|nr:VCBS domain-containing protein [Endozoicomonas sp. SCSIO W0465]